MFKKLGNYLLTGAIIALPITVTVFLLAFLVRNIGTPVSQLLFAPIFNALDRSLPHSAMGIFMLDALSTLVVLLLIATLGVLSRFLFARMLIGFSESIINKIPGVGLVYRTVKQIVDTFSKQNKAVFQSVVMLEFPRAGVYAVGFVTSSAQGEIQSRTGEFVINVFVPTTPNPTSGFLIMVPKQQLTYLDMSVGDAMKLIISGGAVVPAWKPGEDGKVVYCKTSKF